MTRKTALAFGIGASLILAAGTASADCASEVRTLQDQIGMVDGANATIGATDPGVQQPDPSAPADMSAADSTTMDTTTDGSSVTTDNDANATVGAADPGVQQPDPGASSEPTDLSATGSTATDTTTTDAANADGSSVTTEDTTGANATIGATDPGVQQPQNEDMNVTADSSDSGTTVPSDTVGSGTVAETTRSGEITEPADSRSAALASLKKAQLYADAGQEDACMSELSIAKEHMGVE